MQGQQGQGTRENTHLESGQCQQSPVSCLGQDNRLSQGTVQKGTSFWNKRVTGELFRTQLEECVLL